jgi:hypothetical protein
MIPATIRMSPCGVVQEGGFRLIKRYHRVDDALPEISACIEALESGSYHRKAIFDQGRLAEAQVGRRNVPLVLPSTAFEMAVPFWSMIPLNLLARNSYSILANVI